MINNKLCKGFPTATYNQNIKIETTFVLGFSGSFIMRVIHLVIKGFTK